MKYKFFGEPNTLVKTRKRVLFQNEIKFKPLFRFDENGEYVTEDEHLIAKLKGRFDHMEIADALPFEEVDHIPEVEKMVPEVVEVVEVVESFTTTTYKCKHCRFKTTNKGELLSHYKKAHK